MIKILYEDEYITICEKKPGEISEKSESGDSLPKKLENETHYEIFPIHRLDRPVGGVFLCANDKKSAAAFSRLNEENNITKIYLAVTDGVPPEDKGEMRDFLFWDKNRQKSFTVKKMRRGVKEAALRYSVSEKSENHALIKLSLITGRTHQIRVQLASRKIPVTGDGKYGSRDNKCSCALWSHSVSFVHPFTKERLTVLSEPPKNEYPWCLFKTESEM